MFKRRCAACLFLFSMLATGCAQKSEPRMIILMNGNSPFWDAVRVGMKQAADEMDVNATLETNDATPQGQINKLRQFRSQSGVLAVALSATDAANAAIADEMRALREQGVHVITVDSDVDREKFRDARFAFIGTDNFEGGRQLGLAVKNLKPDGGTCATFVGRTGAQNAIERIGGFEDGAGEGFEHLEPLGDENDRTRARENVRSAINNHPELDVLVGIWSYNAPAIVDVVREMNNRDQFTIATFDAEPLAVEQMAAGDIDAMVVQNPFEMGYQAVRLMKALVEDDQAVVQEMFPQLNEPDGDLYDTGLKVVVPDGNSPLEPEMFGESTEFYTLDEFKAWLDKYGLTGS